MCDESNIHVTPRTTTTNSIIFCWISIKGYTALHWTTHYRATVNWRDRWSMWHRLHRKTLHRMTIDRRNRWSKWLWRNSKYQTTKWSTRQIIKIKKMIDASDYWPDKWLRLRFLFYIGSNERWMWQMINDRNYTDLCILVVSNIISLTFAKSVSFLRL